MAPKKSANVYEYPTLEQAARAKALILAHGIEAFLIPARHGARVVAILPEEV